MHKKFYKTVIQSLHTKSKLRWMIIQRKGGIKLKLIGVFVFIILFTVSIVTLVIINLMSSAIKEKAFEVCTTSIERIADFSNQALLERSYESHLNLNEIIHDMQDSKIVGLLDISIYEHQKDTNSSQSIFKFLVGFNQSQHKGELLKDPQLIDKLRTIHSSSVMSDSHPFVSKEAQTDAYRFIKPIIYQFKEQSLLLGIVILHYDMEAINGVSKKVMNISIVIVTVILSFMIGLLYIIGLKFTRPILEIAKAATDVEVGNYDITLHVTSNDEIEELAIRFNHMVTGLREREKMQKYVSSSTMHMITKDSSKEMLLGGEYRTLTFLFTDVRGFTQMSENKKPDEVVEVINFYLNLQSEIIKANGGDIDKFVGDEIMASFSGNKSANLAVKSAVEIQTLMREINKQRKKEGQTVCNVGIGINNGEVIVGNMGSYKRMDFTSIGSTVNLAARLCSSAKKYEILITQTTADQLTLSFDMKPITPIRVKGFNSPIPVVSIMVKES